MQLENQELKKKILLIEESQKHAKTAEVKSLTNTSQRTQETEWYLFNEASFSVSSCSSIDSIVILNDQVDYVKEVKKLTPQHARKIIHRPSNSMQSNCKMDKFIKQVKQKVGFGWSTPSFDTMDEIEYPGTPKPNSRFLSSALLADVPILRF